MVQTAAYWRQKADEMRVRANQFEDRGVKATMEGIAMMYAAMASQAAYREAIRKNRPPESGAMPHRRRHPSPPSTPSNERDRLFVNRTRPTTANELV